MCNDSFKNEIAIFIYTVTVAGIRDCVKWQDLCVCVTSSKSGQTLGG